MLEFFTISRAWIRKSFAEVWGFNLVVLLNYQVLFKFCNVLVNTTGSGMFGLPSAPYVATCCSFLCCFVLAGPCAM
jgi:hypothetical protein